MPGLWCTFPTFKKRPHVLTFVALLCDSTQQSTVQCDNKPQEKTQQMHGLFFSTAGDSNLTAMFLNHISTPILHTARRNALFFHRFCS